MNGKRSDEPLTDPIQIPLGKHCRGVPCPAHTYVTMFGWTWRVNPPYSRHYIRINKDAGEDEPPLTIGPAWTWHVLQYIGPALRKNAEGKWE